MFPVRYELGYYIPEDGIFHSRRRKTLKSYTVSYIITACFSSITLNIAPNLAEVSALRLSEVTCVQRKGRMQALAWEIYGIRRKQPSARLHN
jgi:hypothetical protein